MERIRHYLKLLKEYAVDYVLENTGLKVLALLITAVLWLSVASRPESQITLQNVPVLLRNLPDSPPLTVTNFNTASARVSIRGPRDVLDTLRTSDVTAIADFKDVEPGVRIIQLALDKSTLPTSVKAEVIEPRNIRVTVEREESKEVPIRPRFDGVPPAGYEVIGWHISPNAVQIVGAESHIRDISHVSTETVTLSDKTEAYSEQVDIIIDSPEVSIKDDGLRKPMLTVNIGEVRKERVIDRVPVELIGAPPAAQVSPRFVKVVLFGAHSAIDAMTPDDIQAIVDYAGRQGRGRVVPEITLRNYSDQVSVRSVEPEAVQVR